MAEFTYKRKAGRQLTYVVTHDDTNYEIRQDGELKKRGALPQPIDGMPVSSTIREQQVVFLAERDIEDLVAMDE